MSNKQKQQQQQQQQQHQQQQHQKDHGSSAVVPPRYQPPPQPLTNSSSSGGSGILKSHHHHHHHHHPAYPGSGLPVPVSGLTHLQQQQQLHQIHQQQAARLANQVKEAVQSKFSHNNKHLQQQQQLGDLPPAAVAANNQAGGALSARSEKLSSAPGPAAVSSHGKSFLPTAIPQPNNNQQSAGGPPPASVVIQQQQQQQIAQVQNVVGLPNGSSSGGNSNHHQQHATQLQAPTQPSSSSGQRQRISDEEFLRLGPIDMLKFVRKTESDMVRLAAEQHRQIQSLVNELRAMKEANQRLGDDNQELRDLCCFLDDDRQKGRKLAREWQRFGRYTASVMRQEVSAYQNKLRQLDNKQQELIKDNLELKELCLYLDEERGGSGGGGHGAGGQRDDGDGSSSSTNADESQTPAMNRLQRNVYSTFNDQTMQYLRHLEQKVKQLEEDKSMLQARVQGWPGGVSGVNGVIGGPMQDANNWVDGSPTRNTSNNSNTSNTSDDYHLGSRPEAVVRALQVLEVREQLEREAGHDGEKALVREMCNVVWRKLEEAPLMQNRP
ncbi:coiled-coil domain-containing protein 85C [Trichogramma pretiosum]|uniref:coiled-coil domain-containing protein 85C n=1 Tax=Trichogramma pretiosum TaxID=7493 RepID=UPI0006C98316|nr:coiled-coil domain-containing protein 85C [Trichogramma pretiosum]